jgi:putative flippase GtrA
MRISAIRTLGSFLAVGGMGALSYVLLATILTHAGLPAWLASGSSYAVVTPITYIGQQRFTFRAATTHRVAFPRYLAIQLVGFSLAWIIPLALAPAVDPTAAFVLVAVSVAGLSFFMMKHWAFADRSLEREE